MTFDHYVDFYNLLRYSSMLTSARMDRIRLSSYLFCSILNSFLESSVLLAMAFGHYVAICYLWKYSSILTGARIGRIGLAALCRCAVFVALKELPFCPSCVPSHSCYLHQDLVKLVCADMAFSNWYGFGLAGLFLTLVLISMSHILTAGAILSIASQRERLKALNNCLSRILAVQILYIPMGGLSMVHQCGQHVSPLAHVFMANVYLPLLPTPSSTA
nr:PREDICTED: LOW QUALITY PROTEIN: olfactory receptor 51Q1-like [Balearica regulorum gibbericeps]